MREVTRAEQLDFLIELLQAEINQLELQLEQATKERESLGSKILGMEMK